MEVTDIRCVRREGTIEEHPEGIFQERLVRPTDVYEEFRGQGPGDRGADDGDPRSIEQFFFEEPVTPETGHIQVPDRPGIGVSIDDSTVEAESDVTLD